MTQNLLPTERGVIAPINAPQAKRLPDTNTTLHNLPANRPLAQVIIDSTHLNFGVIDTERNLTLVSPILVMALDVSTDCILGYHLQFGPADDVAIINCLSHAMAPKGYVQTQYPQIKNPWPCSGIPREIVVDHRFRKMNLKAFALAHKIGVRCHPVAQPWKMVALERVFQAIRNFIRRRQAGIRDLSATVGAENAFADIQVELGLLDGLLHAWICDTYHQAPRGVASRTPSSLWEELNTLPSK